MGGWFSNLPDATIPAWLGFFIATALAVIKVWELWRDRFRINVSASFAGDERIGNTIYVRNLSPHAVILTHWQVYYARRFWPFAKKQVVKEREFDAGDTIIEKTSTYSIQFSEQNYFSSSHKWLNGRSIYIKLHFAGRSQVRRRIYPN
ncbi:hypothetical protein LJR251_001372 [Rhizobium rhizogenes]|uniref:hypothetical protein n=1 Tax=Rhizobium rhizogenes TaxID=359 RepID=UPI003ED0A5E8